MIYCLEDDGNIRELVVYTLTATGFTAGGFSCFRELEEALERDKKEGILPELVLLDIMLPDRDGMQILRWMKDKEAYRRIPVIMLTARGAEYDKVTALDAGADDYVTKPFGMMELVSRIRAVLRRSAQKEEQAPHPLTGQQVDTKETDAAGIQVDERAHRVYADGQEVTLTRKEYDLLLLLSSHKNIVLTREQMLEAVWGYAYAGETRTVDVHIRTLRQKLGARGNCVETVRGVGYRFTDRAVQEETG